MKLYKIIKLFVLLLFVANANMLCAQDGVQFVKDLTFKETLSLANKQGKMVFVDCYTDWCGPCKKMTREVFTKKALGDYMNKNFVSIAMNMEKGEGADYKNQWKIVAFPTYVIFDSNSGKELTRFIGYAKEDEFLKKLKEQIESGGLAILDSLYATGKQDKDWIISYISKLKGVYRNDDAMQVATSFLRNNKEKLIEDSTLMALFVNTIKDPENEMFTYVWKNRDDFTKKYSFLERKLIQTWQNYPNAKYLSEYRKSGAFDEEGYNKYLTKMYNEQIPGIDSVANVTNISKSCIAKQFDEMMDLLEKHLQKYNVPDITLYNWLLPLSKISKDKDLLFRSERIVRNHIVKLENAEFDKNNNFKSAWEKFADSLKEMQQSE